DLDGNQIMEILGVGPGPAVGKAYKHLLELRLDRSVHSRAASEPSSRWQVPQ
ncbi:CCA tRNA nucleotidyltransferase, partial [Streptomyces asoensis]